MPRQLSIFFSSLMIFGMIQLNCHVFAQSPKTITNSIGMKLVLIPKGTFMMGSHESEDPVRVRPVVPQRLPRLPHCPEFPV
jgi:formylglycine-generating enzyme required for sulfatase activity